MLELLIGPALEGLKLIPNGKGKRKQAAKYQRAGIINLSTLIEDIDVAYAAGEELKGLTLKMLNAQLRNIKSIMETTADAIDDDTPDDK